jgi:uncharacterized protein YlaI
MIDRGDYDADVNNWRNLYPTEIQDKPNAPIVWHDAEGRDLCGDCAERVDADGDGADILVNWQEYDHRCFLCDKRFEVDEDDALDNSI